MLSYHNDTNLKELVVAEMKKHQEQDQFLKLTYKEINGKFRGCAVGCTIDSINVILGKSYDTSDHEVFGEVLGIPEWLARLQDILFEKLPDGENSQFAVDLLSAIPVGINLEPIKWKFCSVLITENIERVLRLPNLSDELRNQVLDALRSVLNLHTSAINLGVYDESAAESAWSAAESAWSAAQSAWSAAESAESASAAALSAESASAAAWSAAESASAWSESVALSVASAARSAAWASAAAASAASASASAYKRYACELINLLKGS